MVALKKVDAQRRTVLPAKQRSRELRKADEGTVVERDSALLVKQRTKPDLTKYFDVASVAVDPRAFSDYSKLKHAILGRSRQ